jgi:hypothetical protein
MTEIGHHPNSRTRLSRILIAAAGLLFLLFALQVPSPLRLNPDAVTLLHLAGQLTDHQPYLNHGQRPVFPIGVPMLFSLLERAGAAGPAGFAVLNLCCLTSAAIATVFICRAFLPDFPALVIVLIAFSNFTLFKHSVIPLTDIPYLAVSLIALAFMEAAVAHRSQRPVFFLAVALAAMIASIYTRRVGIALIPACILAAAKVLHISTTSRETRTRCRLHPVLLLSVMGAAAAGLTLILLLFPRLVFIPDFHFSGTFFQTVFNQIRYRCTDFGEVFINAPVGKLGRAGPLILPIGGVFFCLLCVAIARACRPLRPTTVYFISYLLIFAVWPYADARFWIPCLPIIVILLAHLFRPRWNNRLVRKILICYLSGYIALSIAAVVFTTRTTYAGQYFLDYYGSADTRHSYDQAISGPVDPENRAFADVFQRYNGTRPVRRPDHR